MASEAGHQAKELEKEKACSSDSYVFCASRISIGFWDVFLCYGYNKRML